MKYFVLPPDHRTAHWDKRAERANRRKKRSSKFRESWSLTYLDASELPKIIQNWTDTWRKQTAYRTRRVPTYLYAFVVITRFGRNEPCAPTATTGAFLRPAKTLQQLLHVRVVHIHPFKTLWWPCRPPLLARRSFFSKFTPSFTYRFSSFREGSLWRPAPLFRICFRGVVLLILCDSAPSFCWWRSWFGWWICRVNRRSWIELGARSAFLKPNVSPRWWFTTWWESGWCYITFIFAAIWTAFFHCFVLSCRLWVTPKLWGTSTGLTRKFFLLLSPCVCLFWWNICCHFGHRIQACILLLKEIWNWFCLQRWELFKIDYSSYSPWAVDNNLILLFIHR